MLLPYQTLVLESALTPPDALERLKAAVEPVAWPHRSPRQRPFEGTVEGTSFVIRRGISYRNSFRPQLRGRIESGTSGGTRVVVAFRLHPGVLVFLAFGLWFFSMFWPLAKPSPGAAGPDPRLVLAGIAAFGVLVVLGCFIPEAQKARRLLQDILDAREAAGETAAVSAGDLRARRP